MSKRPSAADDRLFVREPFRHYRRTYSYAEVRWGLAVLVVLAATTVWIGWKGQNPDPTLFASSDPNVAMELPGGEKAAPTSRGPLPEGMAPGGWSEGELSSFDPTNLYVKINGRADYFLSFGFENLYFLTLRGPRREGPQVAGEAEQQWDDAPVIDIECYDLGTPANALGAFGGERRDGEPDSSNGGLAHLSSNALFLARDRYYIRAIGSEGSEAITAALTHVRGVLEESISGGERPWAHELFNGKLEIPIDAIRYASENAFSFEFAGDVYSALIAGDIQLFVSARADDAAATDFAGKLRDGFAELGTADGAWIKDKFIGTMTTAAVEGRYVIGVRNAPDKAAGEAQLARLREALSGISAPISPPAPTPVNEGVDEGVYDQEPGAPSE